MANYTTVVLSSGVLRNNKKKILLLKRSTDNQSFRNCWQLPEGKLELGEQPEVALVREIKEETELKVDKFVLKGVYSAKTRVGGKTYLLVRVVFECQYHGKLKLDTDHKEANWFSLKAARGIKNKIAGLGDVLETLN